MNTFLKIAIGFVLGVLCFYLVQKIEEEKAKEDIKEDVQVSFLKQLKQQLQSEEPEEKSNKNIQFFDLTTKKGVVRLHTYMSKDSVQILMGYPQSTDVDVWDFNDEVHETWEYKVKSGYGYELTFTTIKFVNGELVSVNQY